MVRTCEVIAHRFRRIVAQKYCACVSYARKQLVGVLGRDLEVLDRKFVHQPHALIHIARDDDCALVLDAGASDRLTRERRKLLLYMLSDAKSKFFIVAYQKAACDLVVLGLAEQIYGDITRICRSVCDDAHFARARDHIDIYVAEYELFSGRYEDIPRARDDIDLADRARAVCHRRDRACAAHLVGFFDP